jgi:hypothetical protein
MAEPENLILVQLREFRADINGRIADLDRRMDERLAAIERQLGMMRANGEKAFRQFIGHRAMMERTVASVVKDIEELTEDTGGLRERVERIEVELTLG